MAPRSRTLLARWLACAVALGAHVAPPAAATAPQASAPPAEQDLEARWRAMSPERRAELKRRFEELRALPESEREALVRRARELERLESDVLDELSAAHRAQLEDMPPEARRRVLRELALDRARQRAERLREALPAERLDVLVRGDRAARERARAELRREHERELPRRVRRYAEELGLPPAEVERLAGLPPDVLRAELAVLARRRMERWIEREGLPEGVAPEAWRRLREAPPDVFARRYGRFREHFDGPRRPSRSVRPEGEGPLGPRGAAEPREGHPPARPGDGEPRAPRARDALRRLRAAGEPTIEERLALARLPPEQRARELGELLRTRALGVLRELGVDADELERLGALPLHRFRPAAREALAAELGFALPPSAGAPLRRDGPQGRDEPPRSHRPPGIGDAPKREGSLGAPPRRARPGS